MSEHTTRRFRAALVNEVLQWRSEGLISADAAAELTARYPIPTQLPWLITIPVIIGVLLVGLGALLFIGANWQVLSKASKIAIVCGAMISAYIGAWHFKYEPGNSPKVGSALLLLGTLLYGVGIFLISQIFNFDANAVLSLGLWLLGTATVTWLTRSQASCFLLSLQIPAWLISLYYKDFYQQYSVTSTTTSSALVFMTIMALGLVGCARVRSRIATYIQLFAGAFWIAFMSGTLWTGLVAFGSALIAGHFLMRQKWEFFAGPFLYAGATIALAGAFGSTFDATSGSGTAPNMSNVLILTACAILPCIGWDSAAKVDRKALLWSFGFAVAAVVTLACPNTACKLVAENALLATMLVVAVVAGVKMNKLCLTYIALTFSAAQMFARYFDAVLPMLGRSTIFVIGGLLLLCAGAYVESKRRRLIVAPGNTNEVPIYDHC